MAGNKLNNIKIQEKLKTGDYYTVRQISDKFGVSITLVHEWRRDKRISVEIVHGMSLVRKDEDLEEALAAWKRRIANKKKKKVNNGITKNGEITDFYKWMKSLNSPTSYLIDYNKKKTNVINYAE
jgi:transcriptional regulator with XRE-family HTH domain